MKTVSALVLIALSSASALADGNPIATCESLEGKPMTVTVEKIEESDANRLYNRAQLNWKLTISREYTPRGAVRGSLPTMEVVRVGKGRFGLRRDGKPSGQLELYPEGTRIESGTMDDMTHPSAGTFKIEECKFSGCAGLRGVLNHDGLPAVEMVCTAAE